MCPARPPRARWRANLADTAHHTQNAAILYDFTGTTVTGKTDGQYPEADLVLDTNGNLYGTTATGGSSNLGVVFERSSNRIETVLHSFCCVANDGNNPLAGLIFGTSGGSGPLHRRFVQCLRLRRSITE